MLLQRSFRSIDRKGKGYRCLLFPKKSRLGIIDGGVRDGDYVYVSTPNNNRRHRHLPAARWTSCNHNYLLTCRPPTFASLSLTSRNASTTSLLSHYDKDAATTRRQKQQQQQQSAGATLFCLPNLKHPSDFVKLANTAIRECDAVL